MPRCPSPGSAGNRLPRLQGYVHTLDLYPRLPEVTGTDTASAKRDPVPSGWSRDLLAEKIDRPFILLS